MIIKYTNFVIQSVGMEKKMRNNSVMMVMKAITMGVMSSAKLKMDGFVQMVHLSNKAFVRLKGL